MQGVDNQKIYVAPKISDLETVFVSLTTNRVLGFVAITSRNDFLFTKFLTRDKWKPSIVTRWHGNFISQKTCRYIGFSASINNHDRTVSNSSQPSDWQWKVEIIFYLCSVAALSSCNHRKREKRVFLCFLTVKFGSRLVIASQTLLELENLFGGKVDDVQDESRRRKLN